MKNESLKTSDKISVRVNPPATGKPVRQDRSLKTYNALLDAAERLLRQGPWEKISTVSIMLEAGCSNGAIYGRFKSKDELLVALYARHDQRLKERFKERRKGLPENETLKQVLTREIDQLVDTFRENRWLLRAMGLLARRRPEVVSEAVRKERKEMFSKIGSQFTRFEGEIGHPDPSRGVEIGVFFVSTILRESILFEGPHFGTLELSDEELKDSLVRMALGFLGATRG